MPKMRYRCSFTEWSGSGTDDEWSSSNISVASMRVTACFCSFSAAFSESHSNISTSAYGNLTGIEFFRCVTPPARAARFPPCQGGEEHGSLLGADARCLDDLGPLRRLGAHRGAELLRRVADDVGAEVGDSFLQLGILQDADDVGAQLLHPVLRRGNRGEQPEPVGER